MTTQFFDQTPTNEECDDRHIEVLEFFQQF